MIECYIKGHRNRYYAQGLYDKGELLVKKGSRISLEAQNTFRMTKEARMYREDREIVDASGIVLKDTWFSSPSTAAQFVTGMSSNGLRTWKQEETKKSLKEIILGE